MDYKEKYLIYKNKYLNLKKKQIGGAPFLSVPNNGSDGSGISLQCIWISIRDYLNYFHGIKISVANLKRIVDLDPDTDQIEYDDDTQPILRAGLERLAALILNVRICFIRVNHNGTIAPISLNEDGTMNPNNDRIINPGGIETIYIATFGRHFELIVEGPNYNLPRNSKSTIHAAAIYQPKINIHKTYVAKLDIKDEQIIAASIQLFELIDQIESSEIELKHLKSSIDNHRENIKKMYSLDLDLEDKTILEHMYISEYEKNNVRYIELHKKLDDFKKQKKTLELIINQ
jgi:hypothetical protein